MPDLMDHAVVGSVADYHSQYKVLRQIANGAFGSVHCVQRRDTKVIHAAKYVKSKNTDLEREVKALRSLSSSGFVLKFISYFQNPNGVQAILVTEFLAGGDLCERTSSKDYVLTEQKCRNIIRQICRGVNFIHNKNFVHLDLKPFNIVFAQKKDDYSLRIIDFGLARELDESSRSVRVGMCGTIEYMSPEVMNCTQATPASDCWGIGVIAYQLLSGGVSPFFAMNRFRTMAKVLDCDYNLESNELAKTSAEAKDFISRLLVKDPNERMNAEQCLNHAWLVDEKLYLGILETLETTWMRKCLARRRWYRLLNAVRLMTSIFHSKGMVWESTSVCSGAGDEDDEPSSSSSSSSEGESSSMGLLSPRMTSFIDNGLNAHDISIYSSTFMKLHLIMNNGTFGTFYCVQHIVSGEVFTAKHVRHSKESMRREASILHKVRNSSSVISFHGLYEAPHYSVIVMDFLVGGDLVERTAQPDFVLNESKCKRYIRQICLGLEHIHKCKVVHLDLKPFSIVFTSTDNDIDFLKITDFSLARTMKGPSDKIKITEMCGCLEFMSPEVLECGHANYLTDCWGVGVISYMLITGGKSPFYGGNRFRTMSKILTAQYSLDLTKRISPEAKNFISKLLIVEKDNRMSSGDCLNHPWLTTETGDVLQTLETSWMKQILARRRWHRWFNAVRAMQRIRKLSTM